MTINGMSSSIASLAVSQVDMSAVTPPISFGTISALLDVVAAVGIDSTTLKSFMDVASMAKDGVFASTNAYASIKSFSQWAGGGQPPFTANMGALAHGMNAVVLLAKVSGNLSGLASYTGLAGGIVNASKTLQGLQEGDTAKVLFSGGKLCAALALTGYPVAGVAVAVAEQAYNRYLR